MAENKMMGRFAGMTTKQKATAIGLVVVVLVILWQVMGLFGGGGSSQAPADFPSAKQPGQMSANTPGKTPQTPPSTTPSGAAPGPSMPGASQPPAANMTPVNQPVDQSMRETPVMLDARIVDMQKQTEQKYIDQLNQLQTLKIQREIAETNQAIASARLATVTAEKSVSDLLTKPSAPVQPVVPAGAYSNTLVNPTPTGVQVTTTEGAPPPPGQNIPPAPLATPAEVPYVVISVSMQMGRWSAVLGYQGKLYNVSIGDVLPMDNSVVASIGKNGVLLVKGKTRRKISILSSI